ncbi:MAG: hypothetical protein JHC95_18785 [Solirubrobacteraceae bacterium]|nr:hypothetical protein [Solirubrobacteraceae bacterium]
MTRRVLIAGLSGPWGAALARELEADPRVASIVGVDERDPPLPFERTEFVRVGPDPQALRRILAATEIDTVVDTRGGDADAGVLADVLAASTVRHVVVAGSAQVYGCGAGDPAYFSEDMRLRAPRTDLERRLRAVEATYASLRAQRPGLTIAVLRIVDTVGGDPGSRGVFALPGIVPGVAGFDPRLQLVHPEDVVAALEHAALERIDGTFNVSGDGVLSLSEIASLLDRRLVPVLPPYGTRFAAMPLRRLGVSLTPELVELLRHGRAVDNRALKATGLRLRYTSREAAVALRRVERAAPIAAAAPAYRYDEGLEEFLRRSPSVRPARQDPVG